MSGEHLRGVLLVTLGALCLVPDASLIRLAGTSDWVTVFWRTLGTAVGLGGLTLVRHRGSVRSALARIGGAGLRVAVLWAATFVLFVYSVNHTAVANTLVVASTAPLVAAAATRLRSGEAVPARTWVAALAAVGGVAVTFSGSLGGGGLGVGLEGGTLDGDLAALGVAVTLGVNLTTLRLRPDIDMLPALALAGLLAALASAPAAWPPAVSARDLLVIEAMGLVLLPAALALVAAGTRYLPSPEVALLMLLETVLGPLLAWPVAGERPPPEAAVGGAIVIAALASHSVAGLLAERRETRGGRGVERAAASGSPPVEVSRGTR